MKYTRACTATAMYLRRALSRRHKDGRICNACHYIVVVLSYKCTVVTRNRLPNPDWNAACPRERPGPLRFGRLQRPDGALEAAPLNLRCTNGEITFPLCTVLDLQWNKLFCQPCFGAILRLLVDGVFNALESPHRL